MSFENVTVCYADVDFLSQSDYFEKAYRNVSNLRRGKTEKLRFREDKNLSLGAELLLMYTLKEKNLDFAPCGIRYGENGKPYLENSNIFFNLSHSGNKVLCAVSRGEIGCDIEKIGVFDGEVAKRFFRKKEYSHILSCQNSAEKNRLFYRYWTLKESFLKTLGTGLKTPLNSFEIIIDDFKKSTEISKSPTGGQYYFKEFNGIDGYACSVCSVTDLKTAEFKEVDLKKYTEAIP